MVIRVEPNLYELFRVLNTKDIFSNVVNREPLLCIVGNKYYEIHC